MSYQQKQKSYTPCFADVKLVPQVTFVKILFASL